MLLARGNLRAKPLVVRKRRRRQERARVVAGPRAAVRGHRRIRKVVGVLQRPPGARLALEKRKHAARNRPARRSPEQTQLGRVVEHRLQLGAELLKVVHGDEPARVAQHLRPHLRAVHRKVAAVPRLARKVVAAAREHRQRVHAELQPPPVLGEARARAVEQVPVAVPLVLGDAVQVVEHAPVLAVQVPAELRQREPVQDEARAAGVVEHLEHARAPQRAVRDRLPRRRVGDRVGLVPAHALRHVLDVARARAAARALKDRREAREAVHDADGPVQLRVEHVGVDKALVLARQQLDLGPGLQDLDQHRRDVAVHALHRCLHLLAAKVAEHRRLNDLAVRRHGRAAARAEVDAAQVGLLAADVVVDKVDQPAGQLAELVGGAQHELLHVEDHKRHVHEDRVEHLGRVRRERADVELVARRDKVELGLGHARGLEHAHAHREVHGRHDARERRGEQRGEVLELAELGDVVVGERLDADGRAARARLREAEDVDVELDKAEPPRAHVDEHELGRLLGEPADDAEGVLVVKGRADALADRAVLRGVAAAAQLVVGALVAVHVRAHGLHGHVGGLAQVRVARDHPRPRRVLERLDALLLQPRGLVVDEPALAREAVKRKRVPGVERARDVQHARAAPAGGRPRGARAERDRLAEVGKAPGLGEERRHAERRGLDGEGGKGGRGPGVAAGVDGGDAVVGQGVEGVGAVGVDEHVRGLAHAPARRLPDPLKLGQGVLVARG